MKTHVRFCMQFGVKSPDIHRNKIFVFVGYLTAVSVSRLYGVER
jgi:hypothetical protein